MTHRTGFHDGRLGIGLEINGGGDGSGKPRYPLDINGDIRLSGAIVDSSGNPIQMMAQQRTFPNAITTVEREDIGDGTFTSDGLKVGNYVDYSFSKETKIVASDKTLHDAKYGDSVAISGNYAIVGSRDNRNSGSGNGDPASTFGAAYIYNVQTGQEIHKLISPNATLYYSFGYSVDIDGNYAIISEPGNNSSKGVAYIFNVATGTNIREIAPNSSDVSNYDYFGRSVAISGNYAIIGASNDDNNKGSAYIFNISTGTQLFKIEDTNGQGDPMGMGMGGDQFGWSVAIDGNNAVVGANGNDSNKGCAFIYNVTTGTQLHKLVSSVRNNNDRFGNSVAISGNYAIIGAPYEDEGQSNSGTAYIFNVITGTQLYKLKASDQAEGAYFGTSVAIYGNYAVIGAKESHNGYNDNGSAYIFDVITGIEIGEIFGSDTTGYERFGNSVGIDGNIIVVGASSNNSAYIFGPNNPSGPILNITDDLQINGNTKISGDLQFYKGTTSQGFIGQANASDDNMYIQSDNGYIVMAEPNGSSHRVGIGTSEPSQKLDVDGTARFRATTYFNSQVYIDAVIYHDGDNSHFGFPQNDEFKIHVNGSDRLYIKSNGNVGIGYTDPGTYKLKVNGNTHINGTLSATTLSGNLAWSNITSKPTTISTTQASNITTNNSKVSSPWSENSGTITYNGYTSFTHYEFFKNDTNTRRYWDGNNIYWTTNYPAWEMALYNGNLGIGTTSPKQRLDVGNGKICFSGSQFGGSCGISYYYGTQSTERPFILFDSDGSPIIRCTDNNMEDGIKFQSYNGTERMIIRQDGKVGIGTEAPNIIFHVDGYTNGSALSVYTNDDGHGAHFSNDDGFSHYRSVGQLNGNGTSWGSWSDIDSDNNIVTHVAAGPVYPGSLDGTVRYSILSSWNLVIDNGCSLIVSSDERIKVNIKDVPDDYALYQLRQIPCRYYRYKDWRIMGKGKTIGFIAQEVREILPMAVKLRPNIIPNIYHHLKNENIIWEEITDGSNNVIYKLHCKEEIKTRLKNYDAINEEDKYYNLENIDVSGVKFKFIVNGANTADDKELEIIGNSDGSFTFKKKWFDVFCYGYEVQDFHSLDKNKLFALNFSATQEIDRVQQEEVGKLAEQTNKIIELETKVTTLESTLETVLARITELENK